MKYGTLTNQHIRISKQFVFFEPILVAHKLDCLTLMAQSIYGLQASYIIQKGKTARLLLWEEKKSCVKAFNDDTAGYKHRSALSGRTVIRFHLTVLLFFFLNEISVLCDY